MITGGVLVVNTRRGVRRVAMGGAKLRRGHSKHGVKSASERLVRLVTGIKGNVGYRLVLQLQAVCRATRDEGGGCAPVRVRPPGRERLDGNGKAKSRQPVTDRRARASHRDDAGYGPACEECARGRWPQLRLSYPARLLSREPTGAGQARRIAQVDGADHG